MNIVLNILAKIGAGLRWFFSSKKKAIITIVLLGILGVWGYRTLGTKEQQPTLQTAQAEKGTLVSTITASGTISVGNNASITTQATGVVSQVYVNAGDSVYQGQPIAEVNLDLSGQQKQAAAYASYVSASNGLLNAQNSLRGAEATVEKVLDDILSAHTNAEDAAKNETFTEKQERTSAEVAKDNAFNAVKTTQAQIGAASLSLQLTSGTIVAPTAGTISSLTLSPGMVIAGNSSNSSSTSTTATSYGTVTLGNSQTQAKVNLSEIDVTKVKTGEKAILTMDAFSGKTFTGKVTSIDTNGSVTSGVTTYPTTITFDTSLDNIYPNMAVSATIITNITDNVLLIPSGAVQSSNGQSTVQVQRNGQIMTVDVEVGDANDTQTEILSGVNEGDTVVTGTSGGVTTTTGTSPFGNARGGFGGGGTGNRQIQFIGR